MEKLYQLIEDFMISSGERIRARSGTIEDIGVAKEYLTSEDLEIERGFRKIIVDFSPSHRLYAEEENSNFIESENLWVADPISNTRSFINGLPHYAIVISHFLNNVPQFAAIYDPSVRDMYTAFRGRGAYLNGRKIKISQKITGRPRVLLNLTHKYEGADETIRLQKNLLDKYNIFRNSNSFAVNYGYIAAGKFDAFISLTKDSFPEFAGSLLIREAGGIFKTNDGEDVIKADSRLFIGGHPDVAKDLLALLTDTNFNNYV